MKHWVSIWLCAGPQGAGHRGCLKLGSGFLQHAQPPSSPSGCTRAAPWWDTPGQVAGPAEMLPWMMQGLGPGQGRGSCSSTQRCP